MTATDPHQRRALAGLRLARDGGGEPADALREDALAGLSASPKRLPGKYFYDERGSALFEAICEIEEYDRRAPNWLCCRPALSTSRARFPMTRS
ncbi:L-histidine N(alpha)-methyltransferase [Bradyrhizobium sp.]|uniref:L-histidine N(alpha)-methyltransferase n=1 Tax=Bradyrhizobium sp. TaxID=376 RepID=UPI003C3EBBB0